jgi:CRISPR-associated protein Cmr2
MATNWRDILVAYLHDPPDKALQIRGHEARARGYLQIALADSVSEAELKDPSDPKAAIAERLPAPNWQRLTVSCEQGRFLTRHPLSGAEKTVTVSDWNQSAVSATIGQLVEGIDGTKQRFLALWRQLADRLSSDHGPWFEQLPADTRIPDHTIWHHLDTTAALKAAEAGDTAGAAFLSFSLGPVQSFIAAARSLRDLWSGSMILAWLTFQGMLPIIKELGPTALVYPALRGLPWLDLWLRREEGLASAIASPASARLTAPCIPNRFLALVPWGLEGNRARELSSRCETAAREAWRNLADTVLGELNQKWPFAPPDWASRWNEQVENYFEIRTAVLPWREASDEVIGRLIAGEDGFDKAFPDVAAVRRLADAIPAGETPGYSQKSAGNWQAKVELSARLMQAQRSIRHVPPSTEVKHEGEEFPPKCSLLGSYEQMGPAGLQQSAEFWQQAARQLSIGGVRLHERERFSAVALIKRFSGPAYFRRKLGLESDDLRYDDTATVAAAEWLSHAGIDHEEERRRHGGWSGQWLHWPRPDFDPGEPCPDELWTVVKKARDEHRMPPAYYAVLMLDGDEMGKWLRGDKSPRIEEAVHPKLREYFAKLPETQAGLAARRPVGPALHAAISEALANFALHFAPSIVEKHKGALIYAGGDDVLAILPARTALACAGELSKTFRKNYEKLDGEPRRECLLMGEKGTVSGGLAIVHYKEDLRFALDAARKAEKAAKNAGRDALQIAACRRSGEHATALCPWEFVDRLDAWVQSFAQDASDRWAYHLRSETEILQGLGPEAMRAEIQRQINRSEEATRTLFGEGDPEMAGRRLTGAFDEYRLASRPPEDDGSPGQRRFSDREAFSQFVTLCQTASFLARGRDA